jgi:hypothetical protein
MPYGMPGMMMPQQQPQILRAMPQPQQPQQQQLPQPQAAATRPTQWQPSAATQPPSVVRGVAGKETPKFVLPRPEALGVATTFDTPVVAPVQVDWNQIQSRLGRLNVVEYHKLAVSGGVQVTLVLGGAQRQQVDARGETEATAILNALQQAETTRRQ